MNRNQGSRWVLLTLILAALPSLIVLPLWVAGIALAGGVLHAVAPQIKGGYGRGAGLLLLGATAAGIWFSFESIFSGKAVLSFFIGVVFVKWGESRTRRDYLLLIFAAVILAAVGALYWENLWSMAHMFGVILALTLSLVALHGDPTRLSFRLLGRRAGALFLLGLPVMLLLFMTFPRIPGPLWDLGLAFGLPVKALMNRGAGEFGTSTTLAPGGMSEGSQENETVLVAEFEGAVPSKSRLYWRGPVFWEYDGENWNLPEDWDNRNRLLKHAIRSKAKLDQELRWKGSPVVYTLRVMPNGGRWLYALDVPAAPAPEAFISSEFQLLSIRKVNDFEPKFKMRSYLDYHIGATLSEADRIRGLAGVEQANPRLYALGQALAAQYSDSEEIVRQAFGLLAAGAYQFDAAHRLPAGPDLLDRYFFDVKKGGAEYLAGSFAMLMRAAGVPARLIGGYRGGTLIALTRFVLVKRSDAHVWVEVWHERTGWVRVEPKNMVLPPETQRMATKVDSVSTVRVELKLESGVPRPERQKERAGSPQNRAASSESQRREFFDFSAWFGPLQKWVIQYDPDRQIDLMEGMGLELEERTGLDLLLGGALGVMFLLGGYLVVARWRGRTRLDPVTQAWLQFCARLHRVGLEKHPQECPRDFLHRAKLECPELAEALDEVIGRYIKIRYGGEDSPEARRTFTRQVQRFVAMM